ncbi:M20/M25/M40 family metallo-hydrolase [Kordiimonas marina]|uniref:M20/M25/M40 family metallo-hydrolase n=1 Tax=Kordiimonas marina TaxID=2872312 RepID=UPI001FF4A842|nr:M20/M25/M40 family metallo-hydrolase [Kordiimonas marina]MCJ9429249.1 M20/M25/M40 family metallo-hydrolase [Kordiimonas marina]
MKRFFTAAVAAFSLTASVYAADDAVNLDMVTKIRDEGFNHSQVMQTLEYLSDEIGPRLTGSPGLKRANEWTKDKLTAWGLKNAHLEGFEFGPGWTYSRADVFMTAPRKMQLYALPISWHPGTKGVLSGSIFYAPIKSPDDFKKYAGELKGKIVLVDPVPDQKEPKNEIFERLDEKGLQREVNYRVPTSETKDENRWWADYVGNQYKLEQFLAKEGALAMVRRSPRGAMLIEASGYQYKKGLNATIPGIRVAAEHYGRLVRLYQRGDDVKMSLDIDATFHNEDMKSYSTIAEIPGKGRHPEIVMAGAHLDSWFVGDGATDNGAGVAVVMEAVRILKALGVQPKRTIRIGLWGGEEQGYYGSYQYVQDHLATRPTNPDEAYKYSEPYAQQYGQFPITHKPGFDRFSVYFNLDNGSGKIRGVYSEGNAAAAAIFGRWLTPFHDLGAKTVSMNATGGTDHEPFDDIGLPGFQFIQDPLDYETRVHHSQIDTFDHAYEADLKQAAVIMASFLYNAAMREDRFPRKPEPKAPAAPETAKK